MQHRQAALFETTEGDSAGNLRWSERALGRMVKCHYHIWFSMLTPGTSPTRVTPKLFASALVADCDSMADSWCFSSKCCLNTLGEQAHKDHGLTGALSEVMRLSFKFLYRETSSKKQISTPKPQERSLHVIVIYNLPFA